ncbi:response regulator [Roseibium alexandrii]|jgi:DNA-binding NarL/FixJ family response regulator|uniref:Protease production enhancer protein n=1 Tax=Roseibium alexandrii TaxID=388408 RepID=A0A0M7AKH7_9HYPH|nr:response regulator transcription factor [Roseibium alexandrii]CTQ75655.1 Protease production enhancer protein [Roseibium alexandrii]
MSMETGSASKFLIIDDHPLFREALHSAVELAYPNSDTLDAASLDEANQILQDDAGFDLALLDLSMPGVKGMDGLLHLRTHYPRLPVVVVSGAEDPPIIAQVLAYGAAGFIPKSSKKTTLADAIQQVMNGAVYVPETYADGAEDPLDDDTRKMIERLSSLTPQQIRVLQMICNGLLNKQIAYELSVGETTVKAHVSEILRKLSVSSRTQAVIEVNRLEALGTASPFELSTAAPAEPVQ